jgi:imidazolonepropionase-like amidohydrolase
VILIKEGLIRDIGKNLSIPPEAEILDARGLFAYPGMIDASSGLGLVEISNVAAVADRNETGMYNPQVFAVEALRPDSVHIPIARANGITSVLVVPNGSFIAGQSGLISLDGRTAEEMTFKSPMAMHIRIFAMPEYPGIETGSKEELEKITEKLRELLKDVRNYTKSKAAAQKDPSLALPEFNETLEFMIPVVEGNLPVFLTVYSEKEIKSAIHLVKEEKLKAVLFGATEAWKVVEEIKESKIPVVLGNLYNMPTSWEDGYDAHYTNASVLNKAGVKFAFSSEKYLPAFSVDLPYQASKAAAFGLNRKEALKGVTIYPAQILGVDDKMGSLEKGKTANIVITNGDILERTTEIKYVFINGKQVSLSNRYTELLDKYKD